MVVVIKPVIDIPFHVFKGVPAFHLVRQFVLHVAVEAFLRSVIPAISFAGHALAKAQIVDDLNELHAGVVAALVTVMPNSV